MTPGPRWRARHCSGGRRGRGPGGLELVEWYYWKDLRDVERDRETGAKKPFVEGRVDPRRLVDGLLDGLYRSLERVGDTGRRGRFQKIADYYLADIPT